MRTAVGDRGHQPGRGDARHAPVVGGPRDGRTLHGIAALVEHDRHKGLCCAEFREVEGSSIDVNGCGHGNERLGSLAAGQSNGGDRSRHAYVTHYRSS